MKQARTLMIQGTASSVGKSTLVTGLCRIFAQDGWRVAPFKAQNMALNSFVTRSSGEIGRAQAVQAEAAGIEPTVDMNPILLKPEGDSRSQVIVLGRPLATMEAQNYYHNRSDFFPIVSQALARLQSEYDLLIIEGAGSPVELNLAHYDLVNMHVAHLANASVLLVGDIDRGGIFASLLGTLMLLPPQDLARVKGLIVNKFRGDLSLWKEGEQLLAERAAVPVLGTVPFFNDIVLAEEDLVALENGTTAVMRSLHSQQPQRDQLEIVVIRLPYLSNYDEFDALAVELGVHLRFVANLAEFPPHPDLIILPGTKNTLSDLAWLWRTGLAQHIRQLAKDGCAVLGICGGYQMLGERLSDLLGAEAPAGTVEPGLNLLPVETFFESPGTKTTLQCQAQVDSPAIRGLFAHLGTQRFQAYQIHLGRTISASNDKQSHAFKLSTDDADGWLSTDGWCAGCYLHGLFENATFRQAIIHVLTERRSSQLAPSLDLSFSRQNEYDKLAALLRAHLDIPYLKSLCNLT